METVSPGIYPNEGVGIGHQQTMHAPMDMPEWNKHIPNRKQAKKTVINIVDIKGFKLLTTHSIGTRKLTVQETIVENLIQRPC